MDQTGSGEERERNADAALRRLKDQAGPSGAWEAVELVAKRSQGGLQTARARYLEQQLVLQSAEELVRDVEVVLTQEDGTSCSIQQALQDAGHGCAPETYHSLSRHLQAAQAMQRLQLPPQHVQGSSVPGHDVDRDGGLGQLLGVGADVLRRQHLPSRKQAQKQHAPLLPELDSRLCSTADEIVACIMGPGDGSNGGISASSSARVAGSQAGGAGMSAEHVVQSVGDRVAAVAAAEACNTSLAGEVAAAAAAYLGQLWELVGLLQGMVQGALLGTQQQLDQARMEAACAHISTLVHKVRLVDTQLLSGTYTTHNVRALQHIHALLQERQAAAEEGLQEAQAQLQAYADCGPEMDAIVTQYAAVKAEIAREEHALQELEALESDSRAVV